MGKSVNLKIADLVIAAYAAHGGVDLEPGPAYRSFESVQGDPDILLRCHSGPWPDLTLDQLVFASTGLWSLYRQGRNLIISLSYPALGAQPYRLIVLNQSFSKGEVYVRPQPRGSSNKKELVGSKDSAPGITLDPFEYPLDEVLMLNYLAQGRGVIIHACGVVDEDRGWLFVGVSGAGKSTLAELWKPTGATLLSDDRIIVRPREVGFRMYGTPWHGDAGIASPESAPLERIFFIEQTARNYVRALSPVDAAARLLVRCFPPFYDKEGMAYTLDFLGQIAEEIPCYELGFVPDASVIDFVRGLK